jgi:DNA-3-methyladenine glycosylase I
MITTKIRCEWASNDPLIIEYHDREWGVPVHDDLLLFEFLILEGAQAGLSWTTILRKREHSTALTPSLWLVTTIGRSKS